MKVSVDKKFEILKKAMAVVQREIDRRTFKPRDALLENVVVDLGDPIIYCDIAFYVSEEDAALEDSHKSDKGDRDIFHCNCIAVPVEFTSE